MKRTKLIAMLLHVLVFMSFILPFQRCEGHMGKPQIAVALPPDIYDSKTPEFIDSVKTAITKDSIARTDSLNAELNKKSLSNKIISFILFDKNDNFTGFGVVYWNIAFYSIGFGFINAFILLLIGFFILRFRKKESNSLILIIDSLGLIFLLIAKGDMWGYWVCIALWVFMVLFDAFLIYKSKQVVSHDGI